MIGFENRPRVGVLVPHAGLRVDLMRALETMGCIVEVFDGVSGARQTLGGLDVHALLVDLDARGAGEWLAAADAPACPRIVLDGSPGARSAGVVSGAEWLEKPFSIRTLEARLVATLERARPARRVQGALDPVLQTEDPLFRDRLDRARRWARGDASINLEGEFGSGRHAMARAIHEWSPRRDHPYLLLEASTLAAGGSERIGERVRDMVDRAREGTLVVVDPTALPVAARDALARGLRDALVEEAPRCLTVSQAGLGDTSGDGGFDPELHYRLEGLQLRLPPLRERKADQEALCRATLRRVARELGRPTPELTSGLLDALREEGFPGNRIGLESRFRQSLLRGDFDEPRRRASLTEAGPSPADRDTASLDLKVLERDTIVRALARWDGNRTRASESLGISVRTLRNKIRDYGLR